MHKVRSRTLHEVFWQYPQGISAMVATILSIMSIPVFGDPANLITGLIFISIGVIVFPTLYYQYRSLKKHVNSSDQPYPADIIEKFYDWQKGDRIKVPLYAGFHNALEGEYIGVGSDNSIILEIGRGIKPTETISGESVPRPKYYELPPNIFKFGYKNCSLQNRLRESEEEKILNKLEESYTDEITEKVKEEIEKEKEQNELEEPERPEVEYLKEYENAS